MFRESIAHLNFCKILGPLEFFVSFWFFNIKLVIILQTSWCNVLVTPSNRKNSILRWFLRWPERHKWYPIVAARSFQRQRGCCHYIFDMAIWFRSLKLANYVRPTNQFGWPKLWFNIQRWTRSALTHFDGRVRDLPDIYAELFVPSQILRWFVG